MLRLGVKAGGSETSRKSTVIKFFCFVLVCAICTSCSPPQPPNSILLLVDDLGWGDIKYRKDPYQLPYIDQLASDGVVFSNAYAASPTCSPCRATIITGQHAARLRMVRHIPKLNPDGRAEREFHQVKGDPAHFPSRNWLPLEAITYAEALKERGYQTGFVGKWHLGHEPYHPRHQGYDVQYGVSNFGQPAGYYPPYFGENSEAYKGVGNDQYLTDQVTEDAIRFIDSRNPETPFHLTVFYYSAHSPFQGRKDLVKQLGQAINNKSNLHHAAMMMAVDESVGRIRKFLKDAGLEDETAILFLGDQGSHFDNSPLRGGKRGGSALYDGGSRIPLIISWPGHIPTGGMNPSLASTVDLFPTLVDIAGRDADQYADLDGLSLLPAALQQKPIEREEIFLYRSYEDQYAAVRSGHWKLIAYRSGRDELYDLEDDSSEKDNLHGRHPEKSRELRQKLADWEKKMGVYITPKSPPMGWNSWNWFGKEDISEKIVREVIDAFVTEGLRDAGYEYIVIDGGWRDTKLGPNQELLPHPVKFPNGIKPLADYAHAQGLKLGLHTVPGSRDCGGDPVGAFGHEHIHVQQFIDWGIDYIKLDKCLFDGGWNEELVKEVYFKWYRLLSEADRDIVFSICAYEYRDWYPEIADIARTTYDISCKKYRGANFDDTKQGFKSIADQNNQFAEFARNGYWNDPDILVIGNQGLNEEEQRVHYALWCVMTSPLMLGNDPRDMQPLERELALNRECLEVNQDPTEQGRRLTKNSDTEIWGKRLQDGSMAVVLINLHKTTKRDITLSLSDLGIEREVRIRNIFSAEELGSFEGSLELETNPHACWFLRIY